MTESVDLEQRFVTTVDQLDLPDADLVDRVLDELSRGEDDRGAGAGPFGRTLTRAAAVVVVLAAAAVVVAANRETVAAWFGIGATTIEVEESEGAGVPEGIQARPPVPAEDRVPVAGIDPLPSLGPPSEVVDLAAVGGRRFGWPAGTELPRLGDSDLGLILSVRPIAGALDAKRLFGDATAEPVEVAGAGGTMPGVWIPSTHELLAAGTDEPVRSEQVLIWLDGQLQYRLEADLDLASVLQLASQVTGGTDLLPPG